MEQRCDHGFLRSVVPCSTCDAGRYRFQKGEALGSDPKERKTRVGVRIAGVTVVEEVDDHSVQVECGCGRPYKSARKTLMNAALKKRTVRCAACHSKNRSEAQTVHGRRRRLSRDLNRQQQQREKQGAAA